MGSSGQNGRNVGPNEPVGVGSQLLGTAVAEKFLVHDVDRSVAIGRETSLAADAVTVDPLSDE